MKLSLLNPKQSLNKAYLKEKVSRENIELFKKNLIRLLGKINEKEYEEHLKNLVSEFLKDTWYKDAHEINTKERQDLVVHTGKSSKDSVGVILEVKKPSNKTEMISSSKPNSKAMHELILYYLRERIDHKNIDVKHLVVTNIYEWFIFDELWFDKNVHRNSKLVKDFENWKLTGKDTSFFYQSIAKPFLDSIEEIIPCTYFDIRPFEEIISNSDKTDDNKLIALFKVLSPVHLLKKPFANDSNTLDTKFYSELLHIIGLEEVKEGSKKLIRRKRNPDAASILENVIMKLEDKDCLRNISNLSSFGTEKDDQLFNVALELTITWINRILFLKLLEAQLFKYHKGNEDYLFLDIKTVHDFDELSNLFFQVLAEKQVKRRSHLKDKYKHVPYLNSSLFERTDLERETFDIGGLDNNLVLDFISTTILKYENGKRKTGGATTLEYLLSFLDAYDFTSEGSEEIQEKNKNLINASVLGLIFEKINGYKDGSFFTPGFVTMYMCRESIRRSVIQKFNERYSVDCESLPELKNFLANRFKPKDVLEFNKVINGIKICDPAVGSGHFLVSALNELLSIKAELGILADIDGERLRGYEIKIENDELIVTYNDNTEIFEYSVTGNSTNKEIQRIQKTLFHEKETIIENCLFGVDINPNSVKICRLRLWIELLKNAYYTEESKFSELETLPNIDINIKCGNSLISRFPLDADLKKALKGKWNIDSYKLAVHSYHEAENKEEKRKLEDLIDSIKKEFRTEIGNNDPRKKKLSKLKEELYLLTIAPRLDLDVEVKKGGKKLEKEKISKVAVEIRKLEEVLENIEQSKIYRNAFEWRFEFPEVLNKDGLYIGFDVLIGNPPYGVNFSSDDKAYLKSNYTTILGKYDSYGFFIERGLNLLNATGVFSYIVPHTWLTVKEASTVRTNMLSQCRLVEIDRLPSKVFDDATVETTILLMQKDVSESARLSQNIKVLYFDLNKRIDQINEDLAETKYFSQEQWSTEETFNIHLDSVSSAIISKMTENSVPLTVYCDFAVGVQAYDSYAGQDKVTIESRAYHAKTRKDKTFLKELNGKDILRFSIKWPGDTWISYGDWLAHPRKPHYFEGPRILIREITAAGAHPIIGVFTDEKYINYKSILNIVPLKKDPDPRTDMLFILGLLSSSLYGWYFKRVANKTVTDTFPRISIHDLKKFPIVKLELARKKYSKLYDLIAKYVDEAHKGQDNQQLIDESVFRLYQLNSQEIARVQQP